MIYFLGILLDFLLEPPDRPLVRFAGSAQPGKPPQASTLLILSHWSPMKQVALEPFGETAQITTGSPLLSALLAKDVNVKMSCGGKGLCATCHVYITDGAEMLSPIGIRERRTLSLLNDTTPDSRLACQSRVLGEGVTIRLPEGMYIERVEDLLGMLGTRAAQNILHPVTGAVLIPRGKIITRTLLEQSRGVEQDLKKACGQPGEASLGPAGPSNSVRVAFSPGLPVVKPNLSGTTQHSSRSTLETRTGLPSASPASPTKSGTLGTPWPAATAYKPVRLSNPAIDLMETGPNANPTQSQSVRGGEAAARPTTSAAPEAGVQIDKYLLIECIGKGGSGVVYRALHTKLRTPVAVKFLRADMVANDSRAAERLGHEARLLAQLIHPNVVRILDFEDDPGRPYVVMEFVDGTTAADLIRQSGRVSPDRAVEIAVDIAAGLEAGRKLGIVHRDVKPGNVLVTRNGTSKLVDLGLAVMTQIDANITTTPEPGFGPIEGTIGYMSPEAITGGTGIDHRSDIYSLGATLYHLITGRMPFAGRSANEVIMKHLRQSAPPPHEVVPGIPHALSSLVMNMLAKSPADRPRDYSELQAALRATVGLVATA